jgi:NAD-dependent DNA ligase
MDKKTFEKNWSSTLKNGRNGVAGLVNSKKINPKLASDTRFVLYEVIDPFVKFSDQMKILKDLDFDVVTFKQINKINFEILSDLLIKHKKDSEYEIDGLIITNNEQQVRNSKGNPDYAFAFKDILEDQKAITKIIDIEWNKSKDGYIKPTLIIEPVKIGGVEINRVTGNNAKYIVENKLGKGAEIEVIRSGDVIPKVENIIKPAKKIDYPEGEWHWNETNVDILCDDLNNKDILIKNIYYFFSSLDAKGVGEKIVEKLVNNGFDSILKIIKLDASNISNIEGFKEKSANNLIESIKKSLTDISLSKLMSASNKLGHGIGEERIKLVLEKYPNLLIDADKWSNTEFIDNLKTINGWEEKTSTLFVNNFNEFKKFYNSIKPYFTLKKIQEKKITKNKYTDKTIVMSGFRDAELQKRLEDSGAKITNSISKNTDYLIVKDQNTIDENTGKVQKAKELEITIIVKEKVF